MTTTTFNGITPEERHGYESIVTILSDQVIEKRYTDRYLELNEEYGRIPELAWYLLRPVPWMPTLLDYQPGFILMENRGRPVQMQGGVIDVPDLLRFQTWLREAEAALEWAGVNHGDMHGENILIDKAGHFTIVDWSWASYGLNPLRLEHNPFFGDDKKMFAEWHRCIDEFLGTKG